MPGRTIGDARKRDQPEPATYTQADIDAAIAAGYEAGRHRLAPPTTAQLVASNNAAKDAAQRERFSAKRLADGMGLA